MTIVDLVSRVIELSERTYRIKMTIIDLETINNDEHRFMTKRDGGVKLTLPYKGCSVCPAAHHQEQAAPNSRSAASRSYTADVQRGSNRHTGHQ